MALSMVCSRGEMHHTPEKIAPQLKAAFDAMAIVKAKIYPAIGNHEALPLKLRCCQVVQELWILHSQPCSRFRIISLNTNFCYVANFYLYAHTDKYDTHGEVQYSDSIRQLQAVEDSGERVWIVGHAPPSQVDCINNWSSLYHHSSSATRPHVIAEQFFGHSHYDEFSLTYSPGAKSAQNAVSTAWIGRSVTPYTDLGPAFRVYKVDTKSWNVFDSLTYIADLDNAPWWHNVTNILTSNPAAFKQFWSYRGHAANRLPDMRSEICSSVVLPIKKRDDEEHEPMADALLASAPYVVTGMPSLSQWGPNAKPWNKKLCEKLILTSLIP
ncbi:hypothetical protein BGW39_004939 [Mortierella sp. 14UC]|nr:hypothetical protein BGW39_004939 [Mortierella sp. 14UC]